MFSLFFKKKLFLVYNFLSLNPKKWESKIFEEVGGGGWGEGGGGVSELVIYGIYLPL